ncbi:MAG TPA: MetQ/NlpA family ABC transporter substrate-binding protein [Enteractinococcus sp.]
MPFFADHGSTKRFSTLRRLAATGIAAATAMTLSSCGLTQAGSAASEDNTISLIVTETPRYQEPTEIAKEILAEDGWELETTYVTDIIQPNEVVSQGEYDANFFQHAAYLRQFNEDNNTAVEPAFSVFYSPSGIFSLQYDSLDELPEGATISIPVDRSNNGRAIHLLAQAGLIEIDESVEITELSQSDITANPKSFEFVEVDQQSSARTLPDVDAAFAFGSSVVEAGYEYDDVLLAVEEHDDFFPFTVFLAVPEGERDSEKIRALQEAYQSPEVAAWFEEYMDGVNEFSDAYTVDNVGERWNEFLER